MNNLSPSGTHLGQEVSCLIVTDLVSYRSVVDSFKDFLADPELG